MHKRSIKTLAVRMERHNNNALEIANFLSKHNKINKVFYPGLISDPNHEVAKKKESVAKKTLYLR